MGRKRPGDPETQYFRYLNRLRAAGRTNMYGAVPYLMRAFGLERGPAFEVICRWVDAFDKKSLKWLSALFRRKKQLCGCGSMHSD